MRPRLAWKREWTWILIVFLSLRLITSALGVNAIADGLPEPLGASESMFAAIAPLHTGPLSQALVNVWLRWDTPWYLKIAASGYAANDGSIAFMPLYPWLIKLAGTLLGGNFLLGAILVSNLAGLMALILLYELARLESSYKTNAMQTVLAMLVFPSAFFLFAAYTESLFLMLVLAAWLCARHKRWLAAGILAALATLCRLQGALLSPVLIWLTLVSAAGGDALTPREQVRAVWGMLTTSAGRGKAKASLLQPAGLAVLLPGAAMLAYQAWLIRSNLGSISQTLVTQWGIRTVMPWEGFRLFLVRLFSEPRVFIDYIDLGILLLMLAVCIYGTFRLDPAYSLYNWLNLGLFFMRGSPPHLLDSFSRYLLLLFPAFLVFGALRDRRLALVFGLLSFIVQLFLVMGFLDWRWVA
ncbi:MAG: hypothetical protein A2X25_02680 [Chloroflexi bacterium GWB2_49_20]|nr:MAG: hypothetical protein A2X25_02680 [Chloroflexi bacterium GWB2_49_20]OGN78788.1 MAG: hypothetical protein A2X26_13100 [Chloroflexi bacterium GWC2_49_37]OGN85842.1 MAG: hypothetical protein A2X27_11585 [Chloroflexi bacterium GWD2_49_16]